MKAFAVAALLGLASTVAGQWTDSYTYTFGDYAVTLDLEADAVYGTYHWAEQATAPTHLKTEAYGLQVYSYGSALLTFTLDTWGIVTCQHTIYPFYVLPYEEQFIYTRPEEAVMNGGSFTHQAIYQVDVLMYETEVTEDYQTFTVSMYNDYNTNGDFYPTASEWVLGDSVEDYVDPYYTGYFTDFISGLNLPSYVNSGPQTVYGPETYTF